MKNFEVLVCMGEFDYQSSITFNFDNWEEAQKFIELSLKNSLTIQVSLIDQVV